VGPDLAQTLAPGVSRTLSIMLLNRSCFFQLLLTPGVQFFKNILKFILTVALIMMQLRTLLSVRSRRFSPHAAALASSPFPRGSYLSAGSFFDTGAQNGFGTRWMNAGSPSPKSFLVVAYSQPCTARATLLLERKSCYASSFDLVPPTKR
jgi:hypothetical protein